MLLVECNCLCICQVLGPSGSASMKGRTKSCRYPKTPLNIPTINSYRRLNGVKAVSVILRCLLVVNECVQINSYGNRLM